MSTPAPTSTTLLVEFHAPPVFFIEPEDRAVHAGVADQQIRAQAQHKDGDVIFRRSAVPLPEFFDRSRLNEPSRRPADLVPRVRRKRHVLRDDLFKAGKWTGSSQYASSCGS